MAGSGERVSAAAGIGLAPERLAELFPFHFAFDRGLRLVQVGPGLRRVCPDVAPGATVGDVVRFARPRLPAEFEALRRAAGELLVLEAGADFVLRGELLEVEAGEALLFLGQPWLTDLAQLGALGLGPRDFPPHSPFVELLHLLQAQRVSVAEVSELAGRLRRQRNELREAQTRLQVQLTESERSAALTRSILETAADGIVMVDERGTIVTANAAAGRLFGYATADLVGRNVSILMPEPHRSEHDAHLERYARTGEARVVGRGREVVGQRRDGTLFPLYLSIGEMRFGDERRFTGILQEVTERRLREEALLASEARMRALVENLLEGLIVYRLDFVIEDLNPAAERIYGYRREELVGRPIHVLLPDDPLHQAPGAVERATAESLNRATERLGRRKSGEVFPVEVQVFEIDTAGGKLLAANVRDLSERHEIDRLKKEFVATVSHELRTPLTSLNGSLGLLGAGVLGAVPDEARDVLAIAQRSTQRLIALINDILDLERLDAGRLEIVPRPTPVLPILVEAVETLAALAGEQGIRIEPPRGEGTVLGDRGRLVQVVVNLLSNAIKFSPKGGRVALRVERIRDVVRVEVRDEGRGVPPDFREVIFEPFRQVQSDDARVRGGTGLGLSICRAIVERHGGSIGVEPRDGPGATFWFALPAAPDLART